MLGTPQRERQIQYSMDRKRGEDLHIKPSVYLPKLFKHQHCPENKTAICFG